MIPCRARHLTVLALAGASLACAMPALVATAHAAQPLASLHGLPAGHSDRSHGPDARPGPRMRPRRARVAIVGGSQISILQAPWQVAVEAVIPEEKEVLSILCGGSILDSAHIVTAAHCVFDSKTHEQIPAEDFDVRAGTADLAIGETEEQERNVTDVRPHPYYVYAPDSGRVLPDDVAVLTLQEPLTLDLQSAIIPMVSAGSSPVEGTPVNVTGFGEENPNTEELNGKLYSLGMTLDYSRGCGGENDAVLLCASSPLGTPCNGDSGSALTTTGSPQMLTGIEDDGILVSGKRCVADAENAFANVAAPEIQDFLDGSEAPPRAPRGGGAIIREAPIGDGSMSCEPGHWSGDPTFTYTFLDGSDAAVLQQGASSTYAVTAADVGQAIACEVQASNEGGTGIGRTPGLHAIAAAPVVQPPASETPKSEAPSNPSASAKVSLVGAHIAKASRGVAPVKLTCVGTGTCQGKLILRYRSPAKKGKRARTEILGKANFSVQAGRTVTVELTLDADGRALLEAGHRRLNATLIVLQTSPGSATTHNEAVVLVGEKARR
jgi:hypothetical protein